MLKEFVCVSPLQSMRSSDLFLLFLAVLLISMHYSCSLIHSAKIEGVQTLYNCSSNNTFTPNSIYHDNVKTLMSWFSSNASTRTTGFYSTTVAGKSISDTVYGLFWCGYGDAVARNCHECVINATKWMTSFCAISKEAIIWQEWCFVRYSNHYFLSTMEESPQISLLNSQDYIGQVGLFNSKIWDLMNDLRTEATKALVGSSRYAYKGVNIEQNQEIYGSAWCIPYLSTENCSWCLSDAIATIPTSCCRGKTGGRVFYPSCGVRFELYPFSQPVASTSSGKRKQSIIIITTVVFLIVVSVVFIYLGSSCLLRRLRRKNQEDEAILKESFGNEVDTLLESPRFNFGYIESATNKFAEGNRIGKGGYGEVYKGILPNGQEVAVKRLLESAGQGTVQFMNEVLVIAQLQHRNLVRLLGYCSEGQENLLIYEYVTNKSLDYFLFDPLKRRQLTWTNRYKIIEGIARGIFYLHEDSRLKIIHRDLKPSNVLLDDNMNPKISDFGMARIVFTDQNEEKTCKIVGTYGYMSPEYAMHGLFSVKSDVYSFGVMILEIISGKRKSYSLESHSYNDIRRYAWTKWKDEIPLELLDSSLEEPYSQYEVIRCIQISLLCVQEDPNDRPTMATVVSYLNNPSADLPLPHEPRSLHRKTDDNWPCKDVNTVIESNYESINEMTVSSFYPR